MSGFTLEQVTEYDAQDRIPLVDDEAARAAVTTAVLDTLKRGMGEVQIRAGAVWDRKGQPDTGSFSTAVSPRSRTEQVYLSIAVLLDYPWQAGDAVKAAVSLVTFVDEVKKAAADEAQRQSKIARAAELRAEADKLESEAKQVGQEPPFSL